MTKKKAASKRKQPYVMYGLLTEKSAENIHCFFSSLDTVVAEGNLNAHNFLCLAGLLLTTA